MRDVQRIAAALPPGVLNVVTGEDAVIGPVLVERPARAKVGFTGSVRGGPADHGDGGRDASRA